MLPIAVDLAFGSEASLLIPLMAAVLSGAVFGVTAHLFPIRRFFHQLEQGVII